MFSDDARAFATDALARAVADRALGRGFDRAIDQNRCVRLYEALGEAEELRYATEHRDVIRRFGRFPHRNRALGRATTAAEERFLEDDSNRSDEEL